MRRWIKNFNAFIIGFVTGFVISSPVMIIVVATLLLAG